MDARDPSTRPLEGICVVDATDEKGELCARLLADLGADVIRLEPPGGAARARRSRRERREPLVRAAQRGQTRRDARLSSATGRALLGRLLASADVLVGSFAPGAPS
jgi:crotonobetainyl-CoA:carnitine CoA-transferase CaiB-like acyl-CoA transferase